MTTAMAARPDEVEEVEEEFIDPHEYRIHVKYITDEAGERVGVVLSPEDWELLLDELGELWDTRAYDRAKAEGGETIPWEDLKAEIAGLD